MLNGPCPVSVTAQQQNNATIAKTYTSNSSQAPWQCPLAIVACMNDDHETDIGGIIVLPQTTVKH